MPHRTLIVARMKPTDADAVASIFAESDATELPHLIGVRRRTLFRFHELYFHLVEADRDITPSLYQSRATELFQDVNTKLAKYMTPYDPSWKEPKDSMATRFYSWPPDPPAGAGQQATKVAAADVKPNRRRGGDVRVILSPASAGTTNGFLGTCTLEPGEHVAKHLHPYSEEYLYLERGAITADVDGEKIELTAGEAVFVPRNTPHRFVNTGDRQAFAVFAHTPLAPRPELGHVDLEEPVTADANPTVGG